MRVNLGKIWINMLGVQMSKIYACYNIYKNADYLAASVHSIAPWVDKVILIDGRYIDFPARNMDLYHGTVLWDLAQIYKDKIHLVERPVWEDQVEKRNAYLDLVPEGAWMIVIDGDEIPFGHIWDLRAWLEELDSDENPVKEVVSCPRTDIDAVACFVTNIDKYEWYPRIIRKREGMKYEDYHYKLMYCLLYTSPSPRDRS